MAKEMNSRKNGYVTGKSLFAIFPAQLQSTLGKKIFSGVLFKQLRGEQGVDILPPTQGACIEHMRRAHVQANIWHQDMVLKSTCLDPLTLGPRYIDQN